MNIDGMRAEGYRRLGARRQRTFPAWMTDLRRRRALALSPILVLLVGLAAATVPYPPLAGALLVAATMLAAVAGGTLRWAGQLLDVLPDEFLDERETGERDSAYRSAFRLVTIGLFALALFAGVDLLVTQAASAHLVRGGIGWLNLMLTVAVTASMVPGAVLVWHWREPLDETDR